MKHEAANSGDIVHRNCDFPFACSMNWSKQYKGQSTICGCVKSSTENTKLGSVESYFLPLRPERTGSELIVVRMGPNIAMCAKHSTVLPDRTRHH